MVPDEIELPSHVLLRLVAPASSVDLFRQGEVAARTGQPDGSLRRRDRFDEFSRRGVGGGQRVQVMGIRCPIVTAPGPAELNGPLTVLWTALGIEIRLESRCSLGGPVRVVRVVRSPARLALAPCR